MPEITKERERDTDKPPEGKAAARAMIDRFWLKENTEKYL